MINSYELLLCWNEPKVISISTLIKQDNVHISLTRLYSVGLLNLNSDLDIPRHDNG